MDASISPAGLTAARASTDPPLVIDVRRPGAFDTAPDMIAGALRRNPEHIEEWSEELPRAASLVVYCVHGHQVSQNAARFLQARGLQAQFLEHGVEGWRTAGGALQPKPPGAATRWITRERPKIDRIACPWLVARFIDRGAEFLYVPPADVHTVAGEQRAIAYDAAGAEFDHVGERCSFDAIVSRFGLGADPGLRRLADIVRAADTGHPELAPEAPGLLAISAGLSKLHADDHTMLGHGMRVYDALYRWCQESRTGRQAWRLRLD